MICAANLTAYENGDGTLEELAEDFHVSVGWAKKISAAHRRTGLMERAVHRPGRKPAVDEGQRKLLLSWIATEHDSTLGQLQHGFDHEAGVAERQAGHREPTAATETVCGKPELDNRQRIC